MRKFGIKYSQLHPRATEVREAYVRLHSSEEIHAVLERWYAEDLPGREPAAEADATLDCVSS
jgi:hypothetical protein